MQATDFTFILNAGFAALLAASFAAIARLNPEFRAPVWFAASYGAGAIALIAVVGVALAGSAPPLPLLVYLALSIAFVLMIPGLAVFYRRRPPWRLVAVAGAYPLLLLPVLYAIPRDAPLFALHQSPYIFMMAACVWVIARAPPRTAGDLLLLGLYVLLTVGFAVKAAVASYLGVEAGDAGFVVGSFYVLISQVAVGIVFLATGLVLLVRSLQHVILEKQEAAETDPLSGIANRRGFELGAQKILAAATAQKWPVSLLLVDLDHFKAVNDTFGHDAGDRAIRAFAATLRRAVPQSALAARIGGEEFAVLLDRTAMDAAMLHAEALRLATASSAEDGVPSLTISIGVAEINPSYDLREVLFRADTALYEAKASGRNRIACAPTRHLRVV